MVGALAAMKAFVQTTGALFLDGKGFTYAILSLYALRFASYALTGHYGRAGYWICAFGITVSAEFLIERWP